MARVLSFPQSVTLERARDRPTTPYELLTDARTRVTVYADGRASRVWWCGEEFFLTAGEFAAVRAQCVLGLDGWAGRNSRRTTKTEMA